MFPSPTLAAALALAAAPALAANLEVTGERDTALVLALDAAVDRTVEAVGACREAGGSLEACRCASRAEIEAVRAALDDALAAHPEWEGEALFLRDMGDGRSLTIFLDTVARQAEPPACP